MTFFVKFLIPPFETDSHPCIRKGGPVPAMSRPADPQAPAMSRVHAPHSEGVQAMISNDKWNNVYIRDLHYL